MLGAGRASPANVRSVQRCRVPSHPLPCHRQAASPVRTPPVCSPFPSLQEDVNTLSLKLKAPNWCDAPNPREAQERCLRPACWEGGQVPLLPAMPPAPPWLSSPGGEEGLACFPWERWDRAEHKPGLPSAATRVPGGAGGRYRGGGHGCRAGRLQALLRPSGWQRGIQVPQHLLQWHRCPRCHLLLYSPGEGKAEGLCHRCKQIP